MKLFLRFLFLIIAFVIVNGSIAQNSPSFIKKDLDKYIKKAIETWSIPGMAICVVKDGEVVFMKGYGLKELNKKDKVNENTLFMIASNTKAFTGTMLANLEYENKCSLDDKVVKWFPEFKMMDDYATNNANLIDILTHKTGLQTFKGDFMYFYSIMKDEQLVEKHPLIEPDYDFRTKYGYSNAGYFFAGKCIEKISGMPWEDYLRSEFFKPLKMYRTLALSVELDDAKNIATGHTLENAVMTAFPYSNIDLLAPAASMSSSVNDMSHWLIAQLNNGRYDGKQVIPAEVIKKTRTPYTVIGRNRHSFNNTHFELYGLGWNLVDYDGVEVVSHTGGIRGFVSSVSLIPEKKLGVVVLTNSDENWFYEAVKWEVIDAYLDLPYRSYSDRFFNYYKSKKEERNLEIKELKDSVAMNIKCEIPFSSFVGRYIDKTYGYVDIKSHDKYLEVSFEHHSDLIAKLEHISSGRFLCTYKPTRFGVHVFPFKIVDGAVISFKLNVADRLEYTSYNFAKS